MANSKPDENSRGTLIALSSAADGSIVNVYADPTTHRLLVDSSGGSGTVTSVSVVSANGFAGTVATATTTPAITLSTSITGIIKGNGTAISAASSVTDYQSPITLTTTGTSGAATFSGNTLNIPQYSGGGTPGGSNTQIQYNNSSAFGGLSTFTTDGTNMTIANNTNLNFGGGSGNSTALKTGSDGTFLFDTGSGQNIKFKGYQATPTHWGFTDSSFNYVWNADATGNSTQNGTATIGANGGTNGAVILNGSTSGSTTLQPAVAASGTLTLPAATDTLVGKATTDVLTNKDLTSGTNTFPTLNQNTTGSAAKWTTARTLAITGDLAYTSPSIDGTGNVTAAGTLATVNTNTGSFGSATAAGTFTVNGKGLITAAGSTTVTPAVGSITGLGTGVATALAVNVGTAGAPVVNGGVLGTPSSGTLTNCGSLPISGLTASTSTAIGVGSVELGNASDTTISRVSGGVVSIEGVNIMTVGAAQTVTGQNKFNNIIDVNNAVTVSSNAGTVPVTFRLNTFTNSSAATMAITMATASAVDGQLTMVRIYDASAVAQTIGWTNTENSTVSVPTTSNGSTTLPLTVGFMFNSATTKWRCIASA